MNSIKIKLEKYDHLKEYLVELERWEGEGGSGSDLQEILEDINLPLKAGEVFEVVDGKIIHEGNHYFYEATLKPIPLNKGID